MGRCIPLVFLAGCGFSSALDEAFGPDGRTIREVIASFPEEQRADFDLMQRRCTRCHTIDEPFSRHIPRGTWRAQVFKMARKPGAGIPGADAERIASFLEYFHARRDQATAP